MRATVVAGMCAGADCIDDIDVVRSGRLKVLFDGVYAPSTVGTLLREFTFDHASTRDHRNRVRRPERRTAGAPADGRLGADSAWRLCVAIGHNLLRRPTLAGGQHAAARGATLRRKVVNIPARLARPQRRLIVHLPAHWPPTHAWLQLWRNTIGDLDPQPA